MNRSRTATGLGTTATAGEGLRGEGTDECAMELICASITPAFLSPPYGHGDVLPTLLQAPERLTVGSLSAYPIAGALAGSSAALSRIFTAARSQNRCRSLGFDPYFKIRSLAGSTLQPVVLPNTLTLNCSLKPANPACWWDISSLCTADKTILRTSTVSSHFLGPVWAPCSPRLCDSVTRAVMSPAMFKILQHYAQPQRYVVQSRMSVIESSKVPVSVPTSKFPKRHRLCADALKLPTPPKFVLRDCTKGG